MTCTYFEKNSCAAIKDLSLTLDPRSRILEELTEYNHDSHCINIGTAELINGKVNISPEPLSEILTTPCIVALLREFGTTKLNLGNVFMHIRMLKSGMPYTMEPANIRQAIK